MILPTKHLNVSQSLLGLGAILLRELGHPMTPSHLWEKVRVVEETPSYVRFLLALDFLYTCDAIELAGGQLRRRSQRD